MTRILGGRSGDFRPPTLEMLPKAVVQNVAIARARTPCPNVAVVEADGYGHGPYTVARAPCASDRLPGYRRLTAGVDPSARGRTLAH